MLHHGDEITLAKHLLKYVNEDPSPVEAETTTQPMGVTGEPTVRRANHYDDATVVVENITPPLISTPSIPIETVEQAVTGAAIFY